MSPPTHPPHPALATGGEERLARMIKSAPIAILLTRFEDGTVLEANPALSEMTGIPREGIVGRTTLELGGWTSGEDRALVMAELAAGPGRVGFEHPIELRDRRKLWGHFTLELIDLGGERCVLTYIQDLTAHRRNQQILEALVRGTSHELGLGYLKALVRELAQALEVRWALVGRLDSADPGRVETVALAADGAIAPNFACDASFAPFARTLEEGTWVCPRDLGTIHADAAHRLTLPATSFHGAALRAADGRALGIVAVLDDRPLPDRPAERALLGLFALRAAAELERMDSEARLRASEEKHRTLVASLSEAIFVLEEDGRVTACNHSAERLFGLDREQMLGPFSRHSFRVLREDGSELPPDDWPALVAMRSGLPVRGVLLGIERPALPTVWVETNVQPLVQAEPGRPRAVVVSLTDVSARREAERERRRLEARLQRDDKLRALGTLAGGVAHDFNNILAAILGNADLALLDLAPGNPARRAVQEILDGCHRARVLVQQVLAFGRRTESRRQAVAPRRPVEEALRVVRATAPAGIEIATVFDADDTLVIGDEAQLTQVALNLCTNACHAMRPAGGRLEVRLERVAVDSGFASLNPGLAAGEWVRLTVSDSGHGMDAATLERIFDPFFTTKAPGEGTGLGLSVVDGIVRSHGGVIRVDSRPGRGTRFEVWLSSHGDGVAPASGEPVSADRPRLLVFDPEVEVAEVAARALARGGFEVESFSDAAAALARLRAGPCRFAAVVADAASSPSGPDLLSALRAAAPGLPLVLLAAAAGRCTASAGQPGAAPVLEKPFACRDLAARVAAALAAPAPG